MSYKSEFQSNNVDLQTILDNINALPEELDTSDATASAADILSGKDAYVNGAKVTGSMVNNGAVSGAVNAGGSYTIPAGYHNGSGKVTGNSLASQTSATAAAGDIASGKTAWVNGSKVTGTLVPASVKSGSVKQSNGKLTIDGLSSYSNFVVWLTYESYSIDNCTMVAGIIGGNKFEFIVSDGNYIKYTNYPNKSGNDISTNGSLGLDFYDYVMWN